MNYREELENLLNKLLHRIQVEFALYCAKDVFHLISEKDKAYAQNCIETVEGYLKGEKTKEDCRKAAYAANAVTTDYAAYAAYAEAAAGYAAAKAAKAANAADAAYDTDWAAYYAAKAKKVDIKEYYDLLLTWINELGTIEKLMYGIEI